MDRRNGLRRIVGKRRVAVESVRDDAAEPIVAERSGQHLELVDEFLHAIDVRRAPREILGLDRLRHISGERHDAVIDTDLHIVEDREVRRPPHLVGDALGKLLIAFRLADGQLADDFLHAFDLESVGTQILLGAGARDVA